MLPDGKSWNLNIAKRRNSNKASCAWIWFQTRRPQLANEMRQ